MSPPGRESSAKPREQKRLGAENKGTRRQERGDEQREATAKPPTAWARELKKQPGSERRPAKASERTEAKRTGRKEAGQHEAEEGPWRELGIRVQRTSVMGQQARICPTLQFHIPYLMLKRCCRSESFATILHAWERDCVRLLPLGWSALCCSVRRPVSKTNSNHLVEFRDLCTMI